MSENRDKRRLIYSIVQFLNRELASENIHSDDSKESLEVANQCLQTAFCLSPEDTHLEVNHTLEDIFSQATASEPLRRKEAPGPEDKEKADKIKGEGNQLMKDEKFMDAISKYTE